MPSAIYQKLLYEAPQWVKKRWSIAHRASMLLNLDSRAVGQVPISSIRNCVAKANQIQ